MSKLALAFGVLLGLHSCVCTTTADILSEALQQDTDLQRQNSQQKQQDRNLEYALKRSLLLPALASGNDLLLQPYDSRERRSSGSSSFIRFGRSDGVAGTAINAPHTRSDIIIRYGRDGINNRLTRLRQERMRKLARLSLICAAKSLEDLPSNSAEEKIIRDMCRDAPLHPTVPDFV